MNIGMRDGLIVAVVLVKPTRSVGYVVRRIVNNIDGGDCVQHKEQC